MGQAQAVWQNIDGVIVCGDIDAWRRSEDLRNEGIIIQRTPGLRVNRDAGHAAQLQTPRNLQNYQPEEDPDIPDYEPDEPAERQLDQNQPEVQVESVPDYEYNVEEYRFPGSSNIEAETRIPVPEDLQEKVEYVFEDSEENGKTVYSGTVNEQGQRHGQGMQVWNKDTQNEAEYQGCWENGNAHGKGMLRSRRGSYLYRGEFLENKRTRGVQFWKNFEVTCYRGQWVDDQPEGLGVLTSKKRDQYAGYVQGGKPMGIGVLKTRGKYSCGEFNEWTEHGHCTTINKNKNSIYKGQFENGWFMGLGQLTPDQRHPRLVHQGFYNRDRKDGFGQEFKRGDKKFVGFFQLDKERAGIMEVAGVQNRIGEFDQEHLVRQRESLGTQIYQLLEKCDQMKAEAEENFSSLVGISRNPSPTVTGQFKYNGTEVELPQPFSKEEIESTIGQACITQIELSSISGDKEAIDELLYIIHAKIDVFAGTKKLVFTDWKEAVPEIECDVLMLLAKETWQLGELHVQDMANVKVEVRESLAMMVIEIIKNAPGRLFQLNLMNAGFDEATGDEICAALEGQSLTITSLKTIKLSGHPCWFNTD